MIEVARSKAEQANIALEFRVDLIEALSFPDASFDVVVSSLMMHHLPDDLKLKGLREIYRVLKPGGQLLVVDMKRPTGLHNHLLMALLHHSGVHTGIQDVPVMMQSVGLARTETGNTGILPMLGFVRGEVSPAA